MTPEELEKEAAQLTQQAETFLANFHRTQAAAITKRELAKRLRDEDAQKVGNETG